MGRREVGKEEEDTEKVGSSKREGKERGGEEEWKR